MGLAEQARILAVVVVPLTEQPVTVCEHVVVYDVQEEPDAVFAQCTIQLDAVLVIEQGVFELVVDFDEECDVVLLLSAF